MFFSPTLKSDWFYAHKASQSLMIILMAVSVFIPLFYQVEEAEAAWIMITVVIIGTAFTVYVWLDGNCDNCASGRETDHLEQCANCDVLDYFCPIYMDRQWSSHPHQSRCVYCRAVYWDCDGENNYYDAMMYVQQVHGIAQCFVCDGEIYRICTDGKEHVHGTGDSGYCSSGCCSGSG
jgi:hypothetical protein